jgi:hypothetical protein
LLATLRERLATVAHTKLRIRPRSEGDIANRATLSYFKPLQSCGVETTNVNETGLGRKLLSNGPTLVLDADECGHIVVSG